MSDWRDNLNRFFQETSESRRPAETPDLAKFIADVAIPAFHDILSELQKHGRDVTIRAAETSAVLVVNHQGEEEMSYRVQGRTFPTGILPYAEIRYRQRRGLRLLTVESMLRSGAPKYTMADITREDVIRSFLENYTRYVRAD
jgi:hypothetical protein